MTKKDMQAILGIIVDHSLPIEVEFDFIRYIKDKNPRFSLDIWNKMKSKKIAERDRWIHED